MLFMSPLSFRKKNSNADCLGGRWGVGKARGFLGSQESLDKAFASLGLRLFICQMG